MAKTASKRAVVDDDELEELDGEELEFEDLEADDEAEEEAPKAKTAKPKKAKAEGNGKEDDVVFGARDLAKLATEETGKKVDPRSLRILLRKMAKAGEIERDQDKDARSRYSWEGPDDPEVKKILKKIRGGAIEAEKKESLEKLKASQQAKREAARAEKEAAEAKASGKKPKRLVVEDDEDDD